MVWVVVDWMAGGQSLGETVRRHFKELVYLPYDWQEKWWCYDTKKWVTNIKVDLMKIKPEELWERVVVDARAKAGKPHAEVRCALLAMSHACNIT